MYGIYSPLLVALSIAIGCAASFVALSLAGRVTAAVGRVRTLWLAGGAFALGVGIWSMHFVGMLALTLQRGGQPVPMAYDMPLMLLSLGVAVAASLIALHVVGQSDGLSRAELGFASILMGAAIAGMNFVGMESLRVPARISWRASLVVASIAIAVGASAGALWLAYRLRGSEGRTGRRQRLGAALLMGFAIAGMHYTAMAAARFTPTTVPMSLQWDRVVATNGLAGLVVGGTAIVLGIAFVGTVIDRRIRARLETGELHERLYLEAERARAAAEAANAAKSEFMATMSHEIRTPINAILGYTELIDLGIYGAVTGEQRSQLERVRASGRHLLRLIDDVLDFARLEARRVSVTTAAIAARGTMESALTLARPQAAAKHIELGDECPETDDLRYLGDEHRARQIVVNLLSNAVKFTPPGGRVTVRCGSSPVGPRGVPKTAAPRWTFLEVEDTAGGIAPQHLELIFRPFVQAESGYTRSHGGTGLGLSISRRLARLMGGELTVRSDVGRGSCFTLWLPAAEPGTQPDASRPVGTVPGTLAKRDRSRAADADGQPLEELGLLLRRVIDEVVAALVQRLRADPQVPHGGALTEAHLENHVRTMLTELTQTLVILRWSQGEPAELLRDGTEIQRVIAERHGAQRWRLGWPEETLRREFAILREEIERALPASPDLGGVAAARHTLWRLLAAMEQVAVRSHHGAALTEAPRRKGA